MQAMLMKTVCGVALSMSVAGLAPASPLFRVTEAYTGVSGADGTPDWFEVTNLGDTAGDTTGLLYDDSSPSLGDAGSLSSLILAPGASAVFLIEGAASDVEDFNTIWGSGIAVGTTSAGGGLGGSDEVNLGTDVGGVFAILDTLAYAETGGRQTLSDPTGEGPVGFSGLGQAGVFESNPFINENVNVGGLTGNLTTLFGSPGVVPEPASLALIGLGAMAMLGRRRAR